MFVICGVALLVIVTLASRGEMGRSTVVMCNSCACKWNKLCRCTKGKIAVYDNTVKGLCLNHTEDMKERILDPMREKRMIESSCNSKFGTEMMDKIMRLQEEKLLKDPDAFAKWMGKATRKKA